MCAPSPPPAPDYAGAAKEQGAANLEAAMASSRLNNPNMYNPYGSQLWTEAGDTGRPTVVQTLSPAQQALLDSANAAKLDLSRLAERGAETAQGVLGRAVDLSGIPAAGSAAFTAGAPALRSADFTTGAPTLRGTDFTATAPALRSSDLTSGAAPLPMDAAATRNAAYHAMMGRVTEDTARRRDDLHSNLVAAGLRPGSKAYDDQMALVDRQYTDAQQQAILSANQQAAQDFAQNMGLRQQTIGEQRAMFDAAQAARQQAIAEQQGMFGASQAARQQAIAEQQGMFGASQAARQQSVAEAQAMQQAMDAQRKQALAEYLMQRQLPLNEVTALMSGSQVQNPFAIAPIAQNAQVQAAPIFAATQAAGQYAGDIYNVQAQQAANLQSGLMGLGGAAAMGGGMAMSDRRLKRRITRVGTVPGWGIGLYEYDIEDRHETGVMADEVRTVAPEAVTVGADGYDRVNYAMLGVERQVAR